MRGQAGQRMLGGETHRPRTLDAERLPRRRVQKLKRRGVQCLAPNPRAHEAVDVISEDGQARVCQVDADLVRPPRQRRAAHQRRAPAAPCRC
jgi:hypothetical protein